MPDERNFARTILIGEVDIGHSRLVDLFKLADLAKPFYEWVESQFRARLRSRDTLSQILLSRSEAEIDGCIAHVFALAVSRTALMPKLFDGVGREYDPFKACYFFFAWLCRDAPQQRLAPIMQRLFAELGARAKQAQGQALARVFARLFFEYRDLVASFEWIVVREVFVDRLEGSRRAIKGHEKEAAVRTCVSGAIQKYFAARKNYGVYSDVKIAETQITLGRETFDVSVQLYGRGGKLERLLLIPVKTRETEGGGHSHIFTRDINSAIDASKQGQEHFVAVIIVAQNWSDREQTHVREITDLALFIKQNPNDFKELPQLLQGELDTFVERVLDGTVTAKTWESIRGLLSVE